MLLMVLSTFIILPLVGRLKAIALASAVGVSAGLITLTVAIMIRWQEAQWCWKVNDPFKMFYSMFLDTADLNEANLIIKHKTFDFLI